MNASEAHDHLRLVDGIVRATDRTVRVPPPILIGVGLTCSAITGLMQARQLGMAIPPDEYIQPPAWLLMLAIGMGTAWRGRHARRETLIDGYASSAFFAAFLLAFTLTVTAQHRFISADGIGLVWAGSFAMALLVIGGMGSRVLLGGGAAMLAAVGAASLVPGWLPGILSAGWLAGFVIPGLCLALDTSRGRTAAV